MRRRVPAGTWVIGLVAVLAVLVAACSDTAETTTTSAPDEPVATTTTAPPTTEAAPEMGGVIGFAYGLETEAAYFSLRGGTLAEAEARGYTLLEGSANGDCDLQVQDIENYITAEVDGIFILPFCGGAVYEDVVAQARDAGIVVGMFNPEGPVVDAAVFYDTPGGSDALSAEAVRWIEEDLAGASDYDGSFSWGLLTFDQCGDLCTTRTGTAKDAVVAATGVEPQECEAVTEDTGLECVENMLSVDPSLNMVVAVGNSSGIGAYEALVQTDRSPDTYWVGGWDGVKEAIEFVIDGEGYGGVAAINLDEQGRIVVTVLADIIEGIESSGLELLLPYTILTPADKDTAATFLP